MLGLLVSEFVNMVEAHHGASVADAILFGTDLPSVGDEDQLDRYPALQLQVLIDVLAWRVGQSPHSLLQRLASRVVGRVRLVNPEVFARHADLFSQIAAAAEDQVMRSYDVDESEQEEIELLFGERAAAECLVRGLQADLARYGRGSPVALAHRASAARFQPGLGMR